MRRRHRKLIADTELDITAFMNLMIILVPVLLIGMVFTHRNALNLNFPAGEGDLAEQQELTQLKVLIANGSFVLADSKGGVIRSIPAITDGYDYFSLQRVLKQVKARLPDKTDITLQPSKDTSFQTLVTTMDTVRSYPAVVAANLVEAELFPDISLARAGTEKPRLRE